MNRLARTAARASSRLPKRVLRRLAGEPRGIDGNVLDLQVQAFSVAAAKQAGDDAPTVDTIREGFEELVAVAAADPVASVSTHDRMIPGPGGDLPVRIYHPAMAGGSVPAVVWFHQGGNVIGGLETDHSLCSLIADRGVMVISVDYRLAPEHPFPAFVDDAVAAHRWVVDHADGLGIDANRVAVAGTSAGGTLAAVVCQQARRLGSAQPAAQILVYPALDITATGGSRESCADTFPLTSAMVEFFRSHALPDPAAAHDERASPGLAEELWGLAPAVVVTAGFDPVRDEGVRYAAALKQAGVSVTARTESSLTHSFTVFGGVSKAAAAATDRLADDVAAALGID